MCGWVIEFVVECVIGVRMGGCMSGEWVADV